MEAATAGAGLDPARLAQLHFGKARLFDKRRTKRLVKTAEAIMSHPSGTLPQKLSERADVVGLYRLARCPDVTHARVLEAHQLLTQEAMARHPGVVLILHDTTELDFSGIKALHDQLGQIGQGHGRGYLCHNSLAVGLGPEASRQVLGLASQVLHLRRTVPKGETPAQKRKHPDRESLLWLAGCENVGPAPKGALWVDVCDRGSDTFEFISHELKHDRHFVIRCAKDRNLHGQDHVGEDQIHQKLYAYVRDLPKLGRRQVQVASQPGQKARIAQVAVSGGSVTIQPPARARGYYDPKPLDLWAIHVTEIDPPAGQAPLEWFLLSDLPSGSFQQASVRIDWYEQRPLVEDFHKGHKSGLGIELPRMSQADHLEPVIGLLSVVSAILLGVRDAGRQRDADLTPASRLLAPLYLKVLAGHSARRAARHGPRSRPAVRADMSVRECMMELARLGGYQARKSDGPPGWQTLWRGWEKLQAMVEGAIAILGERCVHE